MIITKQQHLFYRVAAIVITTLVMHTQAVALTVNAQVDYYDDPNNYLGYGGSIAVGDSAQGQFSYTGAPNGSTPYGPSGFEHTFSLGQASSSIFVNGIAATTSNPTGIFSNVIFDNTTLTGLGYGDFYGFNTFYDSPVAPYTSLIWTIALFDPTATAHTDASFYDPSDASAYQVRGIRAYLWNSSTQTETQLLVATSTVPLPAALWLFVSATGSLLMMKRVSAKTCAMAG